MEQKLFADLDKKEQKAIQKRLASLPDPNQPEVREKRNGSTFKLKGYVRCDLTSSERDAFSEWETAQAPGASLGVLITLVEDGYLLKVSPNASGFQASLCASETRRPWDGFVLVAMARHAARAVDALLYKHSVLLHGDWSIALADDSEDFLR